MSSRRILFLAPATSITRIFPQLKDAGFEVGLAENYKGALAFIAKSRPDVIFSRPSLSGYSVEELLTAAEADAGFPSIVVFSDKGNASEAEKFLQMGAHDYWLEPLLFEKICAAIPEQGQKPKAVPPTSTLGGNKTAIPVTEKGPTIIGSNRAMQRVLALARQVAPSKATVLISGASGTGKEMFSRYLHAHSDRGDNPFIAVNCAALPEHLLESELFGHEKGSFTGAISRKLGKFELAHTGTILLDEISEMDLALQAKLLRVLQEGELDRVGGTETIKVNVRVLATTNRNLEEWVKEGQFRQDLYFRLNVIPLKLPALAERGDDVLELAHFFIDMYTKEYSLPPAQVSAEAMTWLGTYDWPGNVRELQNLMERAVLLAGGNSIEPCHFLLDPDNWPLFEEEGVEECTTQSASSESGNGNCSNFSGSVIPIHEMERILILKGLEQTSGNRTQAADLLGISVRTLRNKLNEYRSQGMEIP